MWLSLIEAVVGMTNRTDEQVWRMPAIEFFAWVAYAKRKAQKQEEQIRKFRAQHK